VGSLTRNAEVDVELNSEGVVRIRPCIAVTKRVRTAGGGASMTVRNLRIREDTAKYLRNLDLSSAYYDPKVGRRSCCCTPGWS